MSNRVTTIGGQAVLEGVMMRSQTTVATAVRDPQGEIQIESMRIKRTSAMSRILKVPVLRGCVAFFDSMFSGIKILTRSAEVYAGADAAAPSKTEKWMAEKLKVSPTDIAAYLGVLLGLGLAVFLFIFLPQFITQGIINLFKLADIHVILKNLIAGGVRIAIFVGYIALTSMVKDIKRLFRYHGAEHKVISCYEHGLELTVQNARTMKTVHDRCGTTFMVIVMVFSIIFFSFFGWQDLWLRILTRLLCLPLVAGLSYELLKLFARYDNFITKIFKAPGLWLQRLTTKEPDDAMLEVALAAFNTVLATDLGELTEEKRFVTYMSHQAAVSALKNVVSDTQTVDFALMSVCKCTTAAELAAKRISSNELAAAHAALQAYAGGMPLQYALGEAPFYGLAIAVNSSVLIPRFDTELVAEAAICAAKTCGYSTVLDLCTGSGAIALALAKNTTAAVTASDISPAALAVAAQNAAQLGADISFVQSDLFQSIDGVFDLIVCNPPYIPTADIAGLDARVKDFEPTSALDGGADGLDFYRKIADKFRAHLAPNGRLILEAGAGQAEQIAALFDNADFIEDYNTPRVKRVIIIQ